MKKEHVFAFVCNDCGSDYFNFKDDPFNQDELINKALLRDERCCNEDDRSVICFSIEKNNLVMYYVCPKGICKNFIL